MRALSRDQALALIAGNKERGANDTARNLLKMFSSIRLVNTSRSLPSGQLKWLIFLVITRLISDRIVSSHIAIYPSNKHFLDE